MSRTSNTLLAFISGAAVGGLLGILYAPDKGENTRDKLTYLLDKYKNQLQDLVEDLVEGEEEHFSEAKEESKKVINDARERAEKLLGDVDELIEQIKVGKTE